MINLFFSSSFIFMNDNDTIGLLWNVNLAIKNNIFELANDTKTTLNKLKYQCEASLLIA